jgi:hypothetical protein
MLNFRRAGGPLVAAIAGAFVLALPAPAQAAPVMCAFRTATIVGTARNDTITGTAGADVIASLGGDDTVNALGGDDIVCLGTGNDVLDAGAGNDSFFAEATTDGADTIAGGGDTDNAYYYQRTTALTIRLDTLANDGEAGEGDYVKDDIENVQGGQNGNRLVGSNVPNILSGGNGPDMLLGAGGDDTLYGMGGNDEMIGGADNDWVFGHTGDDTYIAAAGVDGKDFFEGSVGSDTASYTARTTPVLVNLDNIADDGSAGEGDDMRSDVENIIGGTAGDTLTAHSLAVNNLNGGQGDDTLDTTDGFTATDTIDGSFGIDICSYDSFDVVTNC